MTATALLEEVQMTGINSDAPVKGGVRGKAHRLRKDARAAAERFLVRQSYSILEREWNCSGGSVDLVAQDGDCLVFADVVARDGTQGGSFPSEPNARLARGRMEAVAAAYLRERDASFSGLVRFDVVSILLVSEDRAFVRHHIGAFSGA